MKPYLPFLFFMLCAFKSYSQDSTIALSKFEKFSITTGRLLKTESKEIGSMGAIDIAKVKTTDVATGNQALAIRIYLDNPKNVATVNSNAVYIELEDVAPIIKALQYFSKEIDTAGANDPLYYSLVTPTDVEISCSYSTYGMREWTINIGRVYHTLRTKVPAATYTFGKRRINELIDLLTKAATEKL